MTTENINPMDNVSLEEFASTAISSDVTATESQARSADSVQPIDTDGMTLEQALLVGYAGSADCSGLYC